MANFATIAEMELVLQQPIVGADKIAAADFDLLLASAAVRNYCRQQIERVTGETIALDSTGSKELFLPELPVANVASVVEQGVTLTAGTDYELGNHGILHRCHRRWQRGRRIVQVSYTHGYAVIPDDIIGVTARAASRLYQAGLKAEDMLGIPGVVSKTLGDFSVTFANDSANEGILGVSGARILILSEKDLLDKYRV